SPNDVPTSTLHSSRSTCAHHSSPTRRSSDLDPGGGRMRDAVIVGAVRTAVGRRNGRLSPVRPDDLAAHVLRELVARVGIDASEVEDVILGCVDQVGEQGFNIARNAALIAGFPVDVCGTTLDRM